MKIHNTTLMLIGHTAAMTQWMAQPIASGVRVYTASPQHPPFSPLPLSLSVCHNGQFAYLRPSSITRPKPFWPHHSQGLHLNLPSHSHFPFNTCSSLSFFLLLSTMLCQLLALNRYFLSSPDVTLAIVERVIAGNCFILLLLLVCLYGFLWYLYFCNIQYGIFFQCCCDASG